MINMIQTLNLDLGMYVSKYLQISVETQLTFSDVAH